MVGLCTDIHVRRGGNMADIYCLLLIPFVWYLLILCIKSNILCCGVKYGVTWNSGICAQMVRGSKTVIETK